VLPAYHKDCGLREVPDCEATDRHVAYRYPLARGGVERPADADADRVHRTGTWPLTVGLSGSGPPAAIHITNAETGTWTVRVQDISEAPVWPDVTEGQGDTVLQVDTSAVGDDTRPHGTHDGESNFIVWADSAEEDFNDRLLFNLIGVVDDDASDTFSSAPDHPARRGRRQLDHDPTVSDRRTLAA
jgi:hypothetical protein